MLRENVMTYRPGSRQLSVEYHVCRLISGYGLASDLGAYKASQLPHLLELQTASIQSFTPNTCFTYAQFRTSVQPTDTSKLTRLDNNEDRMGNFGRSKRWASQFSAEKWR
jgi:hypothetical protein